MKTRTVYFNGRNLEVLRETDLKMFAVQDESMVQAFIDYGIENPNEIRATYHPLTQDAIIKANWEKEANGTGPYLCFTNVPTIYQQWIDGKRPNEGSFLTALLTAYRNAGNTNKSKLEAAYPEYFV